MPYPVMSLMAFAQRGQRQKTKQYFQVHTSIDGHRLNYLDTPM